MEENVALDSSKQKQFVKSIKGIKKILKAKDKSKSKNEEKNYVAIGKVRKAKHNDRGLVYLSHIPHGFYEHQMTEYFKQFGAVTNARVIRSKHTGMSKGHAFVEFKDPNVASIVAETMNNYLMGKRLIKAALIPPEKQRRHAERKNWNVQNNPGNNYRLKMKKAHNSVKDESQEFQIARRLLSNLNKTKKKLSELGIDYDFFVPVDIPESLLNVVEVKKEVDGSTGVVKQENKSEKKVKQGTADNELKKSKGKKLSKNEVKAQDPTLPILADNLAHKKSKQSKSLQQSDEKTNLVKAPTTSKVPITGKNATKQQKNKERLKNKKDNKISNTQKQMLQGAGVKAPENFIQIQKESDDECDSSVDFDSDEYDKVMEQDDSDVQSDDETDEELDEDITSDEDESAEDEPSPPKKVKKPPTLKIQTTQNKQQGKKGHANKTTPQQPMKIMVQKAKPSKELKFEKTNKKKLSKVIEKKK